MPAMWKVPPDGTCGQRLWACGGGAWHVCKTHNEVVMVDGDIPPSSVPLSPSSRCSLLTGHGDEPRGGGDGDQKVKKTS